MEEDLVGIKMCRDLMGNRNKFKIVNGILLRYYGCDNDIVLPRNVIEIGEGAFEGRNIKRIVIHNGVEVIGDYAFRGNKLTHVIIPGTVEKIGFQAFHCNPIDEVTIFENETRFGDLSNIFQGVDSITFNLQW